MKAWICLPRDKKHARKKKKPSTSREWVKLITKLLLAAAALITALANFLK